MKEYKSKTGGRYIFNEDIHNLQEMALSVAEMFRDCNENFIISGCQITIDNTELEEEVNIEVGSGYAYIGGKIVYVYGDNAVLSQIPSSIGIYLKKSDGPVITYADGTSGIQYDDYYGVVFFNNEKPNNVPFVIANINDVNASFPDLKTFFKHYCLVNNGEINKTKELQVTEIIRLGKNDPLFFEEVNVYERGWQNNFEHFEIPADSTELAIGSLCYYNPEEDDYADFFYFSKTLCAILFKKVLIQRLGVTNNFFAKNADIENLKVNGLPLNEHFLDNFLSLNGGQMKNGATIEFRTHNVQSPMNYNSLSIDPSGIIFGATTGSNVFTKIYQTYIETYSLRAVNLSVRDNSASIAISDIINFFSQINSNNPTNTFKAGNIKTGTISPLDSNRAIDVQKAADFFHELSNNHKIIVSGGSNTPSAHLLNNQIVIKNAAETQEAQMTYEKLTITKIKAEDIETTTLKVTGNTILQGTLNVGGNSTFGNLTANNITTGTITINNDTVFNKLYCSELNASDGINANGANLTGAYIGDLSFGSITPDMSNGIYQGVSYLVHLKGNSGNNVDIRILKGIVVGVIGSSSDVEFLY